MTMRILTSKKHDRAAEARRAQTSVTFSAKDLTTLAELLVAGHVLLRQTSPASPVIGRLKAAMTRLRVPIPHGL